jgi:hypothetical protein
MNENSKFRKGLGKPNKNRTVPVLENQPNCMKFLHVAKVTFLSFA